MDKNIYGLSEGVFKACEFLGLKFPDALDGERIPSDYFGDDFEFDEATIKKICAERNWSRDRFNRIYKSFAEKFATQKPLKQNKTNLNIYFCDHLLHSPKIGATSTNYLDFEFYRKSFEVQNNFLTEAHRNKTRVVCNDACDKVILGDKCQTNALFANFLRRDWLDTNKCTFEEFKAFAEKHPRFFAKPSSGSFGLGTQIISVTSNESLQKIFSALKSSRKILEEVVVQHETIGAFCLDTGKVFKVFQYPAWEKLRATVKAMAKIIPQMSHVGWDIAINDKSEIVLIEANGNPDIDVQQAPDDTGRLHLYAPLVKEFKSWRIPAFVRSLPSSQSSSRSSWKACATPRRDKF